jgi:hypothetical protein
MAVPELEHLPPLLTSTETALLLRETPTSITRRIRQKKLRAYWSGSRWLVPLAEVEALFQQSGEDQESV